MVTKSGPAMVAGAALCVSAFGAEAALPPWHDRIDQFRTVLEEAGSEIADRLRPHGLVDRIEREQDGSFRAWAGKCHVPVTLSVVPKATPVVGPVTYRASVGKVVCN